MSIIQSGLEGLERAQAAAEQSASRTAKVSLSLGGPQEDVVDISAEAVALMAARNAFEASIKFVETGSDLQEAILDILA